MAILSKQQAISQQHPMPVDVMDEASRVTSVSAENLQLVVASTNANDVGSAAGTVVYGRLINSNVLDSSSEGIGHALDTSLSFDASDTFDTEVAFPYGGWENDQYTARVTKMATVGALLTNGEYVVNYRTGLIIAKKKDTDTVEAVTYKYRTSSSSIVGTVTTTGGTEFAEDIAHTTADKGVQMLAVRKDTAASLSGTDGDYNPLITDTNGRLHVLDANSASILTAVQLIDDAISGAEMQVDVVAALPAGSNLIGEVDVKPIEPSNINTSALVASLVVKASAGTVYEIRGYNSLASTQFIQIHDASSLPSESATPEDVISAEASSNFFITYPQGKTFATGIVVTNSSTAATKTIGAADCWFSAEFI